MHVGETGDHISEGLCLLPGTFRCGECPFSTTYANVLAVHTDERPYKCA